MRQGVTWYNNIQWHLVFSSHDNFPLRFRAESTMRGGPSQTRLRLPKPRRLGSWTLMMLSIQRDCVSRTKKVPWVNELIASFFLTMIGTSFPIFGFKALGYSANVASWWLGGRSIIGRYGGKEQGKWSFGFLEGIYKDVLPRIGSGCIHLRIISWLSRFDSLLFPRLGIDDDILLFNIILNHISYTHNIHTYTS